MSNSNTLGVNSPEWGQAADSAKKAATAVGAMAGHAASAVGGVASQAAHDVGTRADDLTASAGARIQGLGDQLSKGMPHNGMLGNASQSVAQGIKDGGQYVERAKLSGMSEDVTELIRRNPITAVLIAVGLGWFVSRLVKR